MVSLSWLLVVAVACARLPGFGSACLDRSQCDELNGEGETQVGQTVRFIVRLGLVYINRGFFLKMTKSKSFILDF